jgi:hypothetical protein
MILSTTARRHGTRPPRGPAGQAPADLGPGAGRGDPDLADPRAATLGRGTAESMERGARAGVAGLPSCSASGSASGRSCGGGGEERGARLGADSGEEA